MKADRCSMTLGLSDDGWVYSSCDCGWLSPPCPGREEASGFWADHVDAQYDGDARSSRHTTDTTHNTEAS